MAYFLGCDVSKRKLDLCLVDSFGTEQWSGQVVNEPVAIAESLLAVVGNYSEIVCVVEATSSYHIAFAETTYAVGLQCLIFNPILTRQQIRATVRGKKTDKTLTRSWWPGWGCAVKAGRTYQKSTGQPNT